MITKIISAFPGTGKSHFHKEHPDTTLDSDSSEFSWIVKDGEKIRNPDFPTNYIDHIKDNIGKYDFIFVSSHKEVRDALINDGLYFYLVYPSMEDKDIYITRYKNRGNPESFINLISDNWKDWLYELSTEASNIYRIQLSDDDFISDKIKEITTDTQFNLKWLNAADKYTTEYGYLTAMINATCIDVALFGRSKVNNSAYTVNQIINIIKTAIGTCDDIDDVNSMIDKMQHEVIELDKRNTALSKHDRSWDK
jgi:hypothetical protein